MKSLQGFHFVAYEMIKKIPLCQNDINYKEYKEINREPLVIGMRLSWPTKHAHAFFSPHPLL